MKRRLWTDTLSRAQATSGLIRVFILICPQSVFIVIVSLLLLLPCFQIKGSDAGWTLGYMLNLTNMIPAEAPDKPPLPYAGYVSIVTIMTLLIVFLFLLVSLGTLWPRCSKETQIV